MYMAPIVMKLLCFNANIYRKSYAPSTFCAYKNINFVGKSYLISTTNSSGTLHTLPTKLPQPTII